MARFKNHLLVVVGFALAGMIGAAFGTGTAQAVVSTLVTVVNPGTSPVHTSSVDDPGRIAYQATVLTAGCSGNQCFFNFPSVPTGHRVVVQHVSGVLQFTAQPTNVNVFLEDGATGNNLGGFFPPTTQLISLFEQPALFYVNEGASVKAEVDLNGNSANFVAVNQSVTLTGYELDCTVAACAPIATQ